MGFTSRKHGKGRARKGRPKTMAASLRAATATASTAAGLVLAAAAATFSGPDLGPDDAADSAVILPVCHTNQELAVALWEDSYSGFMSGILDSEPELVSELDTFIHSRSTQHSSRLKGLRHARGMQLWFQG